MAEALQVGTTHVKIRNPFGVFVLSIVTFGIYYLVWYYKVNRELRDAARIDVSPVVALLAVSIGWFIIVPPFVSWYRTFERIQSAQRRAGLTSEANRSSASSSSSSPSCSCRSRRCTRRTS